MVERYRAGSFCSGLITLLPIEKCQVGSRVLNVFCDGSSVKIVGGRAVWHGVLRDLALWCDLRKVGTDQMKGWAGFLR